MLIILLQQLWHEEKSESLVNTKSFTISILTTVFLFCVVRKPADLQNLAPGTNPPFVTFNGEVKVDVNKIEEFLEEKLTPPRYKNTHLHMHTQTHMNIQ